MLNLHKFYAEQCEHCKDLLREAEKERLIQEVLASRPQESKLYDLIQTLADFVRK